MTVRRSSPVVFMIFLVAFAVPPPRADAQTGGIVAQTDAVATGIGGTQAETSVRISALPWWAWIGLLFATTFLIGVVAVLGGVGGGLLFIPIVGTFFPFHSDFVRCTGLLIALAGSLSAGPMLIRKNLANLRLAIPAALIASAASIFGARAGLSLPSNVVQIATAVLMTGIIVLLLVSKKSSFPVVPATDALGKFLDLGGAGKSSGTYTGPRAVLPFSPLWDSWRACSDSGRAGPTCPSLTSSWARRSR
jgi:hypothetical protein